MIALMASDSSPLSPGVIGIEAERQILPAQPVVGWGLMGAHRWVAVLGGTGQLELASGLSPLAAGDVLLIRAGQRYRITASAPGLDMAVMRLRARALAPNQSVDRVAAEVVAAAAAVAQRHAGHLRLSPTGRRAQVAADTPEKASLRSAADAKEALVVRIDPHVLVPGLAFNQQGRKGQLLDDGAGALFIPDRPEP